MSADQDIDWARLDSLLDQVMDLPGSERQAWIETELSDEPKLRARLIRLVSIERDHKEDMDTLMLARDRVLSEASSHLLETVEDLRVGARYGKWRILERIGEGGLSLVYRAERADDRYEQTVALKVLRASVFQGSAIRYFIRERRILSSLNHPGLARMIDGGETATGTPWLVMEYVDGVPITDYCRENDLPLADRLKLVAQVADATQAAHNRLIVHRDIKPANVLVEANGRVRLLDFGIAQLVSEAEEEGEAAPAAMTPAYASPEQMRQAPASTDSDIYQLGRLMQDVLEGLPLSARYQAVLDKVLADDPNDRYETAAGFAADLRHLVAGEAPNARPDTPLEALGRAVQRNRLATLLMVVLLLGLAGWAITTSVYASALKQQKDIALAEADRATRGKRVLLDIFRRSDPLEIDGHESGTDSLLSLLEPSLGRIRNELYDDPVLQSSLIGRVSRARQRAGNLQGALDLAREAEQVLRDQGLGEGTAYASAKAYRASLQIDLGDAEAGFAALDETLEPLQAAPDSDMEALNGLLVAAWAYAGNPVRQEALFGEVRRRATVLDTLDAQLEAAAGQARVLYQLGNLDAAEASSREAIALGEAHYGKDHPRLATPLSQLGGILRRQGEYDRALESHRRGLEISRQVYGPDHHTILAHRNNIALTLASAERYEEAIEVFKRVREAQKAQYGEVTPEVGNTTQNLGTMQMRSGAYEEALVTLREAKAIYEQVLDHDDTTRAFPDISIASTLISLGRYKAAEESAQSALDQLARNIPGEHFATEISRCLVGIARLGQGDREGARPPVRQAASVLAGLSYAPESYREDCLETARELGVSP